MTGHPTPLVPVKGFARTPARRLDTNGTCQRSFTASRSDDRTPADHFTVAATSG